MPYLALSALFDYLRYGSMATRKIPLCAHHKYLPVRGFTLVVGPRAERVNLFRYNIFRSNNLVIHLKLCFATTTSSASGCLETPIIFKIPNEIMSKIVGNG